MTAEILKGFRSEEIIQNGYDKIKTFGVGAETTLKHWHDYLLQMLQLGYIEIAYNEANHLKITASGNEVLFGKKKAELALPPKNENSQPKASRTKSKKRTLNTNDVWTLLDENDHVINTDNEDNRKDNSLFEILRKVRKQIADENNWPAYVVLSDKTLKDLAYKTPLSLDELQDVFGFGEVKIEKFGQRFVNAIREYLHA